MRHSARVFLNDRELGVRVQPPFRFELPEGLLKEKGNGLVVEVCTLAANRVRDLDRRGVDWKSLGDIGMVHSNYKRFEASDWPVQETGLLGPVSLMR